MWLLRKVHASRISTYAYVNPVIAIFLGWLFAGEQFTFQMLLAAGVIIVAVVLIIRNQSQPVKVTALPRKSSGSIVVKALEGENK